ncbi:MAG: NosD domain-containing protein [Candidatus Aenigmarchaeota archaeon]|nr:NosD domain-containing protein [Candidatus Aenigmarchaeota archaeon]
MIMAKPKREDAIRITSNCCRVENFTIAESYNGIHLLSGNNTIINNNIFGCLQGLHLSHEYKEIFAGNNTIINNNIFECICGLLIEPNSPQNAFKNNNISYNEFNFGALGLSLEDFIQDMDTSNLVEGKPIYYLVNKNNFRVDQSSFQDIGFLAFVNCTNINVENLALTKNYQGILLAGIVNSTIAGNTIMNNYHGIYLFQATGNKLSNNTSLRNINGIRLYHSKNNSLVNNVVINNDDDGIALCSCTDNSLISNNVSNNEDFGLGLWGSNNNKLINNIAIHNSYGILLDNSHNNILNGNIVNSSRFGIELRNSTNNMLLGNTIMNNDHGIEFDWKGSSNRIAGNKIANNRLGIYFWHSNANNNTFFHNSFINNMIQVRLRSAHTVNVWDSSYPSGGNYWSNHKLIDEFSGPYQNETGSDGICDKPYVIDENNKDNYPLMRPWITPPSNIEVKDIIYKEWNYLNVPFDIEESEDYVENFLQRGKPAANFGTIPVNMTLENTSDENAENVQITATISGNIVLVKFDPENAFEDRIIFHHFEYNCSQLVGNINVKSSQLVKLNIPVNYTSIIVGPFTIDFDSSESKSLTINVLFMIVCLNVDFEVSGSNFDPVHRSIKLKGVGNPYGLAEEIIRYLNERLGERVQEDIKKHLVEYIFSLGMNIESNAYVVAAGSTEFFDTTVKPETSSLIISTILPEGVTLLELSITIGTTVFALSTHAVYGFATMIIKPPDLIPGSWTVTIKTACPDVNFTLTVTKINSISVNKTQLFNVTWEDKTYHVVTFSNSTITNFNFSQPEKRISFSTRGLAGLHCFCNITIPIELLDGKFTVWIDDDQTHFIKNENATHSFLYFVYDHAAHKVKVVGTTVIPELSIPILIVLMTITLLAVIIRKFIKIRRNSQFPLFFVPENISIQQSITNIL